MTDSFAQAMVFFFDCPVCIGDYVPFAGPLQGQAEIQKTGVPVYGAVFPVAGILPFGLVRLDLMREQH